VLRGLADERERRDLNLADAGGLGADIDLGDPGDDERRADDDGELVGSGGAIGVDVRAADVGVGEPGEEQQEDEQDG
jgi:hypothetical protein